MSSKKKGPPSRDVVLHFHCGALSAQAVILQSTDASKSPIDPNASLSAFLQDLKWQFLPSGDLVWSSTIRKVPIGQRLAVGWLIDSHWRADAMAPQTPPLSSAHIHTAHPMPKTARAPSTLMLESLKFASLYTVPHESEEDRFIPLEIHAFASEAAQQAYLQNVALANTLSASANPSSHQHRVTVSSSPSSSDSVHHDAYWNSSAEVRQHLVNLLCGAAYFGDNELMQRLVLEEKVDMQAPGGVTTLRNLLDVRGIVWVGKNNTSPEFDCNNVFDISTSSLQWVPPLFFAALRGRIDSVDLLLQLGARASTRVPMCFPDHPLCIGSDVVMISAADASSPVDSSPAHSSPSSLSSTSSTTDSSVITQRSSSSDSIPFSHLEHSSALPSSPTSSLSSSQTPSVTSPMSSILRPPKDRAAASKPFSALDIATWNAERQCCALLSEAMENDPDRNVAQTHGMAPSLPLNNDDIKSKGDGASADGQAANASESSAAQDSDMKKYTNQRTSCPTM